MRHSKRRHKLGVTGPHRAAMLGNLAVALITHGRIETTLSKAKALRPFIEKVITLAKKAEKANDAARKLHFRRLAIARVRDKKAVATLFDDRVNEFVDRPGGYTRIYKLGQRVGDAAEMALIELIDGNDEGYEKPKKKAAKKSGGKAAAKESAPAEENAVEAEPETVEDETGESAAEEASSEAVEEKQPEEPVASEEAEAPEDGKDAEPDAETGEKDKK